MPPWIAAALSFAAPGLGQAVRGRVGDGLLMLWTAGWLRLILAGVANGGHSGAEPLDAALVGLFAFERPAAAPIVVVASVLVMALHVWSASDARRDGRGAAVGAA